MDLGLYNKTTNQSTLIGNWVQDRAMRELYAAGALPSATTTQRITSHSGVDGSLIQTTTAQDSFRQFGDYDTVDVKTRVQTRDFGPLPTKGAVMQSTIVLGSAPVPAVTTMQSSFIPLTSAEAEASRAVIHKRHMRHDAPGFDHVSLAASRYNC
jgi:hypothetical protein